MVDFFNGFPTSNKTPRARYLVYRRYGDGYVDPYLNIGPFNTIQEANLAAEQICASEFGIHFKEEKVGIGMAQYHRLSFDTEPWGSDDTMTLFVGLE